MKVEAKAANFKKLEGEAEALHMEAEAEAEGEAEAEADAVEHKVKAREIVGFTAFRAFVPLARKPGGKSFTA